MMHSQLSPCSEIPLPDGLYGTLWKVFSCRMIVMILRVVWVLLNNLYCIPVYFVYMLLFAPLLLFDPDKFWRVEELFFDWMLSMVSCWNYTAGYRIVESGASLESIKGHGFLYMPNHQSTADVPLCMTIFTARRGFCDKVMWVMDKIFKYTNFGWVAYMHDDFFILAGKSNRDKSLEEFRDHLRKVFVAKGRRYLVLFPEGGFLRKRKAVSQSFAKKNNLPHLDHCTLPRTGALEVVLNVLGPKADTPSSQSNGGFGAVRNGNGITTTSSSRDQAVTKIVDVTIAYPEGKPLDLQTIISGSRQSCITHVHYRVFDVKDLPSDPEKLRHWMYNLYAEKDKILEEFYRTGRFPYEKFRGSDTSAPVETEAPRELYHDPLRYVLLHLFFIVSSIIAWKYSAPIRLFLKTIFPLLW